MSDYKFPWRVGQLVKYTGGLPYKNTRARVVSTSPKRNRVVLEWLEGFYVGSTYEAFASHIERCK